MDDPNPAATLWALQTQAAASAVVPSIVPTEELMTVSLSTGDLLPALPPSPSPTSAGGPSPVVPFDNGDLLKLALIVALAAWAGSALFGGRS